MQNILKTIPALAGAVVYFSQKNQPARCDAKDSSRFEIGVTLNPMFEKRYRFGEDAYVAKERFICVTDGVGGWQRKLVDPGLFTKEFVQHMSKLYDNKQYSSLKELLDNASKLTKARGSSTCVMAELTDN